MTVRQFQLQWLFIVLGSLAILFAIIGIRLRPVPSKIPEAALLQHVGGLHIGMGIDEINQTFGFEPSASWLDESGGGYVCWRFEVSDVPYANSRASYFAKLEDRQMASGYLFYPLESAGGGMVF